MRNSEWPYVRPPHCVSTTSNDNTDTLTKVVTYRFRKTNSDYILNILLVPKNRSKIRFSCFTYINQLISRWRKSAGMRRKSVQTFPITFVEKFRSLYCSSSRITGKPEKKLTFTFGENFLFFYFPTISNNIT